MTKGGQQSTVVNNQWLSVLIDTNSSLSSPNKRASLCAHSPSSRASFFACTLAFLRISQATLSRASLQFVLYELDSISRCRHDRHCLHHSPKASLLASVLGTCRSCLVHATLLWNSSRDTAEWRHQDQKRSTKMISCQVRFSDEWLILVTLPVLCGIPQGIWNLLLCRLATPSNLFFAHSFAAIRVLGAESDWALVRQWTELLPILEWLDSQIQVPQMCAATIA